MSIGQRLRQERERRGVSLSEIAKETRVSSRHLEAIETGDTRVMPRDFFYRSFVRQYGRYLGLDDKEIDAGLALEFDTPVEPPAASASAAAAGSSAGFPASVTKSKSLSVTSAPTPVSAFQPAPQRLEPAVSPRIFLQESRTSGAWLALAGLLLAASVSYLAWDRIGGPKTPTPVASAPSTPVATQVQDSKTITTTMANGTTVQATQLDSGQLKLVISAKEPAWIHLEADGKAMFVGLLDAGKTQSLENVQQVKLLTGNAGGIEVMQNGKAIPELGSRGEVRTVVFSKEAYQVVPNAQPKQDPPPSADAPKSEANPVAEE